jgi:hypothetical protein
MLHDQNKIGAEFEGAIQSNPIQSNPIQSNPIQSLLRFAVVSLTLSVRRSNCLSRVGFSTIRKRILLCLLTLRAALR